MNDRFLYSWVGNGLNSFEPQRENISFYGGGREVLLQAMSCYLNSYCKNHVHRQPRDMDALNMSMV